MRAKRNQNVDFLRAIAMLVIIIYHCYVLSGNPWSSHIWINTLMSFGGEIGVTLFFVLSGFGIFCSLHVKDSNQNMPNWRTFMKQRCIRIMPQYYACIFFLLIFQSAGMIGRDGLRHIIAYVTFTQNFFISTHGSINGALWAMATIFQFYLLSIFFYRFVKKNWYLTAVGSIIVTVISKYIIYHFLIPSFNLESVAYFVYGRQLISALDNFVLGMAAAKVIFLLGEKEIKEYIPAGIIGTFVSLIALVICSYMFCSKGIYSDTLLSYVAHSVLAVIFACLIVSVTLLPQSKGVLIKPVNFFAKYQYGMYLWHMPVIVCLYNNSPLFQYLISRGFIYFAVSILLIVMVIGYCSSKWIVVKNKK